MKYPTTLGENGPGGYGKQWTCITATNYSNVAPESKPKKDKPAETHREKRPAPEGMIRLPDAAAQYGCPYKTLYMAVKNERLHAVMHKGDYVIRITDLLDFIDTKWRGRRSA